MQKLKKLYQFIRNYPKLSLVVALMLSSIGYLAYDRVPSAFSCSYAAVVDQGVPWDKWRFNWMSDKCQYYNGTRWIPLQKVMDVGADMETLAEQ